MNNTSAAGLKNVLRISLDHKHYCFKRTESGFYDFANCHPLSDGRVPDRDGLISNAIRYTDEEVADLLAESEARAQQLEIAETLLKEWIELRRSRSRNVKQRPRQLQKPKPEVIK